MALVFVCVTAYCAFFSIVPVLCVAAGARFLANSAIDIATNDVNTLNEMNERTQQSHDEMLKHFCSIINDVSDIKELS